MLKVFTFILKRLRKGGDRRSADRYGRKPWKPNRWAGYRGGYPPYGYDRGGYGRRRGWKDLLAEAVLARIRR